VKLNGKNIILTGASSGIGLELLQLLLQYDVRILAVARNIDKITFSDSKMEKYSCDISVKENIDNLLEHALLKFGTIDIYIANAGFAYYEIIKDADYSKINSIFNTNVFSTIYSFDKLRVINAKRPFSFAVTASAMSFFAIPGYTLYSSTKSALKGWADCIRWETSPDHKLIMVYPIATITNFFKNASENNAPMPWPRQTAKKVANEILKGIINDSKEVFPSKIFSIMKWFFSVFPFLFMIYGKIEAEKMKKYFNKLNSEKSA